MGAIQTATARARAEVTLEIKKEARRQLAAERLSDDVVPASPSYSHR